jgi:hypothetical protein
MFSIKKKDLNVKNHLTSSMSAFYIRRGLQMGYILSDLYTFEYALGILIL